MRVGIVAPLWEAVPPRAYGAIEYLVDVTTKGLSRAGHQVTLFASGDSTSAGSLVSPCHTSLSAGTSDEPEVVRYLQALQVIQHPGLDLIHAHLHSNTGMLWLATLKNSRVPCVYTLHCSATGDRLRLLAAARPEHLICLSQFQAAPLLALGIEPLIIPNGIDFHDFEVSAPEGTPYLAFLGRLRELKGVHLAIDMARRANMQLKIAGRIKNEDREYYRTHIQPLLGPDVELVGELDWQEKKQFLSGATALLFTSTNDDPFGIVMLEAMACGTPVVALDHCAAREVVVPGITGYITSDTAMGGHAIRAAESLDRPTVRQHAEQRFGAARFLDAHIRFFEEVLWNTA